MFAIVKLALLESIVFPLIISVELNFRILEIQSVTFSIRCRFK